MSNKAWGGGSAGRLSGGPTLPYPTLPYPSLIMNTMYHIYEFLWRHWSFVVSLFHTHSNVCRIVSNTRR